MGHVYFKVSQHLNKPVSYVIRNKFNPDVKFLIFKYSQMLREKQREYEEIKNKSKEL